MVSTFLLTTDNRQLATAWGAKSGNPGGSLRKSLFRGKERSMSNHPFTGLPRRLTQPSLSFSRLAVQSRGLHPILNFPYGLRHLLKSLAAPVALVLVIFFTFAAMAIAAERGRMEGVVSDQAGAKISGAR